MIILNIKRFAVNQRLFTNAISSILSGVESSCFSRIRHGIPPSSLLTQLEHPDLHCVLEADLRSQRRDRRVRCLRRLRPRGVLRGFRHAVYRIHRFFRQVSRWLVCEGRGVTL